MSIILDFDIQKTPEFSQPLHWGITDDKNHKPQVCVCKQSIQFVRTQESKPKTSTGMCRCDSPSIGMCRCDSHSIGTCRCDSTSWLSKQAIPTAILYNSEFF